MIALNERDGAAPPGADHRHRIIPATQSSKGQEALVRDSRQDFTTYNPLLLRGSKSLP
jgi:hypothetical protein